MYTIKEASERTGISRDMIRHYEKLGLISPGRGENRYRYYSDDDLLRLVMIRFYSNMGIGLREMTDTLRQGDMRTIVMDLSDKAEQLEWMRRRLTARADATKHTLACLEQYAAQEPFSIRTVSKRYLYSRDNHPQEDYAALCARIAAENCFFQYYYALSFEMREGYAHLFARDLGLMLYDPLPFPIVSIAELKLQRYYQKTVAVPRGFMLGEAELQTSFLDAAHHSDRTRFTVLIYQVFASDAVGGQDIVSVEIPLEEDETTP